MNDQTRVFIIDDDAAVRDALSMLLETAGHTTATFACAEDFLGFCTGDTEGCLILDVNMPGMDGPALQEELLSRMMRLPILFLSGKGTIPTTVRTIKAGAIDFLTKPVDGERLLGCVQEALHQGREMRKRAEEDRSAARCLETLTERERQVMLLAVEGLTSKEIAQRLGISFRTVEIHRAHAMRKAGVSSPLELAGIFLHFNRAEDKTGSPHLLRDGLEKAKGPAPKR